MQTFCKNYWLYFIIFTICFSCHNSNNEASKDFAVPAADKAAGTEALAMIPADTLSPAAFSSADRKFIRTADIKFKTNNVTHTTQAIESLTKRHNGFVTHTSLTSSVIHTSSIPISADSLLEGNEYIIENTMTMRVPNNELDSLLNEIQSLADFIDFRIVKADDISLQLLENTLRIKRAANAEKRYTKAIDERSKKLAENIQAEEDVLALQNESDSRTISTMAYMDKVIYSTVSLQFYQPATYTYKRIFNHENIKAYRPSLMSRLSEAFATGWHIFEELLVFLVSIWAILLSGFIGFWIFRRYRVRLLGKF